MAMIKASKERKVDNIDIKILQLLSADAREPLKNIAKKCRITPVAALKRIRRLKKDGVIVSTYLLIDNEAFDNPYEATVLVDASNILEDSIKTSIRQTNNVIICAESIGRYNLCALIVDHDINGLNETVSKIRGLKGVNNVSVNIWKENRYINFTRDLTVTGRT
jgi:Lrp/AsnC family transcriptional regulator for asnA, asnC and gidA